MTPDTTTDTAHEAQVDPMLDESTLSERLFALLLERRGWTSNYLASATNPEHPDLLDIDRMAAALHEARTSGKKVTIAPDFDMDGITSGVLGYAGLSELGFDVSLHMPDYTRGHDLTEEDIEEIHRACPGTGVLLTCDGGVNSHRGIAAAKAKGWLTLVTDHHQELEPGSSADITVNPCRIDETYPNKGICGAHVLYQVIERYARTYCPQKTWEIGLLKLFAGIGTVSDVMPILMENRQLLKDSLSIGRLLHVAAPMERKDAPWLEPAPEKIDIDGSALLQVLRAGRAEHSEAFVAAFEGYALVLKAFAMNGKLRDRSDLDEGFYGFYLAPAMNAPRRIGTSLLDCFDVFLPGARQDRLDAMQRIIDNNELRKQMVVDHTEQMLEEQAQGLQPHSPWIWFSDAPKGMLGLLANKLMHDAGHPVVVLGKPQEDDEARSLSGSARAPEWFDVIASLEAHGDPALSAIGHAQACGVRVGREELLDGLVDVLRDATEAMALQLAQGPALRHGDLVFGDQPDADAALVDADELKQLVRMLENLRPFGHGFEQPVYEVHLGLAALRVKAIGSEKQHLSLTTRAGLRVLWWNRADLLETLQRLAAKASGDPENEVRPQPVANIRATAKLQLNEFKGHTSVQLVIDSLIDPLDEIDDEAGEL